MAAALGEGGQGGEGARPSRWTRRDALAAGAIFLAALALRLLHLQEIHANDPFFTLPSVDPRQYHDWAVRISEGEWIGEGVFFLGPLYPYVLGVVYTVFGPSFVAAKALQALLGALSCVLVFGLAREIFDRRVATLAGAFAAVYAMLIFYGGSLMIVNVQVALVLALVWLSVRGLARPTLRIWLAAGLVQGLSALARQTVLLYAPMILVWLFVSMRGRATRRRRAALVAAYCAGAALAILPATARNATVGGDLVLINSTGGYNLWLGNHARADGTFRPPVLAGVRLDDPIEMRDGFTRIASQTEGRELSPSEVSAFWTARALEAVREDPARWLGLELRKLGLFLNHHEVWNNRSYEVSRSFSWVLRLPLLGFGALVSLALAGIALSVRRWRTLVPLYAMLLAYLGFALAFFVLSRWRMPAAVVMFPFAAFGVTGLLDAARARRWPAVALAVLVLGAGVAVAQLSLVPSNLGMAYYNLANKYRALEQWDLAIESYRESLARDRSNVSVWNNLAITYEASGEHRAEAAEAWRVVLGFAERSGNARYLDRARRHLRRLGYED